MLFVSCFFLERSGPGACHVCLFLLFLERCGPGAFTPGSSILFSMAESQTSFIKQNKTRGGVRSWEVFQKKEPKDIKALGGAEPTNQPIRGVEPRARRSTFLQGLGDRRFPFFLPRPWRNVNRRRPASTPPTGWLVGSTSLKI